MGGSYLRFETTFLDTVNGIDAIDVEGYAVVLESEQKQLPYPLHEGKKVIGKSFHHGKFIQSLRKKAATCEK
jgi:squalene monooxygenase